ncbi:MAG: hypothetical protein II221_04965, partial [Paludibacteraceae bacterium]|nr:hypothetical protein [Paludibacteraceae bacterium]
SGIFPGVSFPFRGVSSDDGDSEKSVSSGRAAPTSGIFPGVSFPFRGSFSDDAVVGPGVFFILRKVRVFSDARLGADEPNDGFGQFPSLNAISKRFQRPIFFGDDIFPPLFVLSVCVPLVSLRRRGKVRRAYWNLSESPRTPGGPFAPKKIFSENFFVARYLSRRVVQHDAVERSSNAGTDPVDENHFGASSRRHSVQ